MTPPIRKDDIVRIKADRQVMKAWNNPAQKILHAGTEGTVIVRQTVHGNNGILVKFNRLGHPIACKLSEVELVRQHYSNMEGT